MATNTLVKIPASTSLVTTAETAVVTTTPVQVGGGSAGAWLSGDVQVTVGAGTTNMTVRCRFGSGTGGALVDTAITVPVTAGNTISLPFNFFDLSNANEQAGGTQYTITLQQTAATGNGTTVGGHVGIEV